MLLSLTRLLLAATLQAEDAPSSDAAMPPDAVTPPDEIATFTRYQVILDRKPFGNVAATGAAGDAGSSANPNQPPLSASLRLVALETDDTTGAIRAGLVDAGGKKSYYLTIGEEDDGVRLVNADFRGDRALIRKGDQEEWLSMGSGSTKAAANPLGGPAPVDASSELARRQRFRDMMAARMAQRNANTAAPPMPAPPDPSTNRPQFKSNEEMKEYYRKINLDLIRSGGKKGPPLPIALTPEDDAQLVKEGVLPPIEPEATQ